MGVSGSLSIVPVNDMSDRSPSDKRDAMSQSIEVGVLSAKYNRLLDEIACRLPGLVMEFSADSSPDPCEVRVVGRYA